MTTVGELFDEIFGRFHGEPPYVVLKPELYKCPLDSNVGKLCKRAMEATSEFIINDLMDHPKVVMPLVRGVVAYMEILYYS